MMALRAYACGVVAAGIMAAGSMAAAAASERDLNLRYEVYWGGMHAADFVLSTQQAEGNYQHDFRLRSQGMFNWLLGLDVSASATGQAAASLPLAPRRYDVEFTNRWRRGDIAMRFDPQSGAIESSYRAIPPRDNPDSAAEVSPADRQGALDPLAAFLEAVRRAGEVADGSEQSFRLKVFDGRRRFDASGEVLGVVQRQLPGGDRAALHLRITTLPVAGFNSRQMELWDGKVYDIYLSTDGRLVPLKISAEGMGPHINLIEECASRIACLLPGEDRPRHSRDGRTVAPPG